MRGRSARGGLRMLKTKMDTRKLSVSRSTIGLAKLYVNPSFSDIFHCVKIGKDSVPEHLAIPVLTCNSSGVSFL